MSDHGTHHQEPENGSELKSKTSFRSSFWVVLILVGLFIAALNFIQAMGGEGHSNKENIESMPPNVRTERRASSPTADTTNMQNVPEGTGQH